jgi:hypothetical protein
VSELGSGRIAYCALVLTLLHVVAFLTTELSTGILATSLGLFLDILGAYLLVANIREYMLLYHPRFSGASQPPRTVTEHIAVLLARVFATADTESNPDALGEYTDMTWGFSLLVIGFVLQLAGAWAAVIR